MMSEPSPTKEIPVQDVDNSVATGFLGRLGMRVRNLYPGYFALVMATGIVSNTAHFLGYAHVSDALLLVNLIAFPLLLACLLARVLRFHQALWRDLINPKLVFSFFTLIAASDVFGMQLLLRGWVNVAVMLWLFALLVWVCLSYFSFSVLTFVNSRSGADVIHGGWLIAIVGTESLVLLGVKLAPYFGELASLIFVAVHMLWGIGVVFYGIFITLFSYRLFFLRVEPEDMTPLFWVVMGAAAISTNAGSMLILANPPMPFLQAMRPFVDGTTLILWAWATWWIPLLIVFGIWRYGVRRTPFVYHPMFWSLVFPLGMYALATYRLALAADFPPLQWIPPGMLGIALFAWTATMTGTLRSVWRAFRPAPAALRA